MFILTIIVGAIVLWIISKMMNTNKNNVDKNKNYDNDDKNKNYDNDDKNKNNENVDKNKNNDNDDNHDLDMPDSE